MKSLMIGPMLLISVALVVGIGVLRLFAEQSE